VRLLVLCIVASVWGMSVSARANVVCAGEAYPDGDVITGVVFDTPECGSAAQFTTTHPPDDGRTTDVCLPSPIPPGFVIVPNFGHLASATCFNTLGTPELYRRIRVPPSTTSGIDACDGSLEGPTLVRVAEHASMSGCANRGAEAGTGKGWHVALPRTSGATSVCFGSNVPPDYVIVARNPANQTCDTGGSGFDVMLPKPTGSTTVCSGTPVPDGYTFNSISNSKTHCGFDGLAGPGFDIFLAADGDTVCTQNPPAGFVITAQAAVAPTQCAGQPGYFLSSLPTPGHSLQACDLGAPAAGVLLTARGARLGCPLSKGRSYFTPDGNGPYGVCTDSFIPDGFVITSRTTNAFCGPNGTSGRGMALQVPSATGATVLCATSDPIEGPVSPIPLGFAITSGLFAQTACGGAPGYTVSALSDNGDQVVCSLNIPSDFVVTAAYTPEPRCSGSPLSPQLGYRVARPAQDGSPTAACDITPLPANFVITGRGGATFCSGAGNNHEYSIRLPSGTSSDAALSVCSGSHVPAGYIISAHPSFVQGCSVTGGSGPGFAIKVPLETGDTACADSPIPANFVITANNVTSQSCGGPGRAIKIPSPTGNTVVCANSPIPDGFHTTGSVTSATCGSGGALNLAPSPTGLDPTPFVDPEPPVSGPPTFPQPQCSTTSPGGGLLNGAAKNTALCP
jgi:hypothetical protein